MVIRRKNNRYLSKRRRRRRNYPITTNSYSHEKVDPFFEMKKELRQNLNQLNGDRDNFGVKLELTENELDSIECSDENLKRHHSGLILWLEAIQTDLDNLKESINKFTKLKMLNNLEDEREK